MRQRLGLAARLLAHPELLILDEPANGLDPEGVHWLRTFIRGFAAAGKTVFVSSHVLAEVAQTVDRVVIIDKGRLVTIAGSTSYRAPAGGVRIRGRGFRRSCRDSRQRASRQAARRTRCSSKGVGRRRRRPRSRRGDRDSRAGAGLAHARAGLFSSSPGASCDCPAPLRAPQDADYPDEPRSARRPGCADSVRGDRRQLCSEADLSLRENQRELIGNSGFAAAFAALIGVMAMTSELRYGTIRASSSSPLAARAWSPQRHSPVSSSAWLRRSRAGSRSVPESR